MAKYTSKEIVNFSDEEFLKILKKFMEENEVYTSKQFVKSKFINLQTLYKKLNINSWFQLIEILNLQDKYKNPRKVSKEELIQKYKEAQKKLNKEKITITEFEKEASHGIKLVSKLFGSWKEFVEKCDSELTREINVVTETNEELIEMYQKFSEKLGKIKGASIQDIKNSKDIYSYSVFVKRFGSWVEFKKLAGYYVAGRNKYTKEEILKKLSIKSILKGRRLSQNEIIAEKDLPALETILKAFKTTKVSQVWDEIEGKNKTQSFKTYTKEEIKDLLWKEYLAKGNFLSVAEIKKNKNLPGISTIYRKYKTTKILDIWNLIKEEMEHNDL